MASTESERSEGPILGIDLGTTNSLVAVVDEHGPRILEDATDGPMLPSVVRYGGVRPVVGRLARDHAVEHPETTIYSAKRLMGRSHEEIAGHSSLAYSVVPGPRGMACVAPGETPISPQEVSAEILRALRMRAEVALGRPLHRAVVTVPAYFDDAQRQATRDAGRLAGLDVVRMVNEPTAAALAYGLGSVSGAAETIVVYDLGGGTFDVSVLRVVPATAEDASDGEDVEVGDFFQVLATAGDTRLGGDDLDELVMSRIQGAIDEQFGRALAVPPSTRQALRTFAERARVALSEVDEVPLAIDLGEGRTIEDTLDRPTFDAMAAPLIERTIQCCRRALHDAGVRPEEIDRVVMVGGATRTPAVRKAVGRYFGVTPYTALDPDQVVALGAAVQASILSGSNRETLLLDVIPLSLGIETVGGAVAKLIHRNTSVPARATEMFSTSVDGQVNVSIHVLQGEREMVNDCRSLGQFDLRGVPPMPAGVPQIEVEFLVDANGILDVSAVERRSGKRAAIQVVPRNGLTRDEVDRMERESVEYAREDMHAHRVVDLVVNASLDIKWIQDALDRVGAALPTAYAADLRDRLDDLRHRVETARADPAAADAEQLAAAKQSLDEASVRLHEVAITESLRGMPASGETSTSTSTTKTST